MHLTLYLAIAALTHSRYSVLRLFPGSAMVCETGSVPAILGGCHKWQCLGAEFRGCMLFKKRLIFWKAVWLCL